MDPDSDGPGGKSIPNGGQRQSTGGFPPTPISTIDPQEREAKRRVVEAQKVYGRGRKISTRQVKDKKLRSNLRALETKYKDAVVKAKDAEILLENQAGFLEPEGGLERTYKVRQEDIRRDVPVETAKKGFELKLEAQGPYKADYTRNGRSLLLAGQKGHVATMDWRAGKLGCELQLAETIRDAKWLHNDQYFAVAQKKYTYIYDHNGVEIHCLDKHIEVTHMEFLPYHFLLATIGNSGHIKYTDTSTGRMVIEFSTRLGSPTSMTQNPYNAILHVGHQNGTTTLWSPNSTTPLVKLLTHRGPVRSLSVDREGRYMVSTGQDLKMAVWDIRMFKELSSYTLRQPGSSIAISDRGLTAVGWGTQLSIWKDLFNKAPNNQRHRRPGLGRQKQKEQQNFPRPYMSWGGEGHRLERVRWCPFEDVLGVSHDSGFSSILVPGAGEPNFDALELNPYETPKQRQEAEVKSLLNKIQPEMISLKPDFVGDLDLAPAEERRKERDNEIKAAAAQGEKGAPGMTGTTVEKNRSRGRNSALRKYLRKKGGKNIVDERRLMLEAALKEQNMRDKEGLKRREDELGPALARFARKAK
ncbi:MAG: Small subunit (SSU) processome component [Sclerophora amabilis]|nr:MAG: Small subunit (SSU) processome component [Sclerophora amabilis]